MIVLDYMGLHGVLVCPMSWITLKTRSGVIKIKPRWQLRWAERTHQVRVLDLGLLVISWWSHDDLSKLS